MKLLKIAIICSIIFSGTQGFAKNPHDSDSSFVNQNSPGKIVAAESAHLNREVVRLEKKLDNVLSNVPDIIDHDEGRIIAIISNQVERDLEEVKKDIEEITYQRSTSGIYLKLEEIEKDIDMI
ncbi:hypothetical protein A9Q84_20825 [Halobacteriovorax marinus]|uniref:Secreted protein n=1 Tax=Halobacteriovorax marinus TaxID=97084 RepID=A0A1Y5F1Q6_9BACT|nr:hypothetical protein A9Q84_20825 [Halobacteriovorax marinus]